MKENILSYNFCGYFRESLNYLDIKVNRTSSSGVASSRRRHLITTAVKKETHSQSRCWCRQGGAHRFAEESCGDVPALFVLRVAAASTSVDGHTRRFIENVGGGPELPAHVHTHLPGDALSPAPLALDTCRRHDKRPNAALVDKTSSATSRRDNTGKHSERSVISFDIT